MKIRASHFYVYLRPFPKIICQFRKSTFRMEIKQMFFNDDEARLKQLRSLIAIFGIKNPSLF